MYRGDSFGEMAAKGLKVGERNRKRSATIVARSSATEMIVVERKDFALLADMDLVYSVRRCVDVLKCDPNNRMPEAVEVLVHFVRHVRILSVHAVTALGSCFWEQIHFFQQLDETQLTRLCRVMRYRTINELMPVFEEGSESDAFYVVLSGVVTLHRRPDATEEANSSALRSGMSDVKWNNDSARARLAAFSGTGSSEVLPDACDIDNAIENNYGPLTMMLTAGDTLGEVCLSM